MHPYLTPSEIRLRVYIIASIAAVLSAWLLAQFISMTRFEIPWYVETPSVIGFLGLYLLLHDRLLWRIWPLRVIPWMQIPNLNGSWDAFIRSSHEGFESSGVGTASIRQSYSKISVSLEFPLSTSRSQSASLFRDDVMSPFELLYHYQSDPRPEAPSTMEIHQGTTRLSLTDEASVLAGDYYTGRGRLNFGSIEFRRKEEQ